jgi:hypothetical protein
MKKGRNIFTVIVLAVIGAVGWAGPVSAQNRGTQGGQSASNVPPPGRGDHEHDADDRGAFGQIGAILKNQQQILEMLNNLQNTTMPNQQQVLGRIVNLQDSILAGQATLIKEVSGLELACTTPDLLPLPLPGGGYCRLGKDSQGQPDFSKLHVIAYNQGGGGAAASTTSVFFHVAGATSCGGDCAEVDMPTSPLAGFGGSMDLSFDVPSACYDTVHDSAGNSICEFKISVDSFSVVPESNESNNNAAGQCLQGVIIP